MFVQLAQLVVFQQKLQQTGNTWMAAKLAETIEAATARVTAVPPPLPLHNVCLSPLVCKTLNFVFALVLSED